MCQKDQAQIVLQYYQNPLTPKSYFIVVKSAKGVRLHVWSIVCNFLRLAQESPWHVQAL